MIVRSSNNNPNSFECSLIQLSLSDANAIDDKHAAVTILNLIMLFGFSFLVSYSPFDIQADLYNYRTKERIPLVYRTFF
jgi:hypothetical protein